MHILLIEPDRVLAGIYCKSLEQDGHTTSHISSAQAAIHLCDETLPDVVILELQLPKHNGIEFLYEFRSYQEWLGVPVIIHSFIPPAELNQAIGLTQELGVEAVLYKPATSLDKLRSAVRAAARVSS